MTEEGKRKTRERMLKNNPMKNEITRIKSAQNHKGQKAWNVGLKGDEYKKHFLNGVKGGRQAGYNHTVLSKDKMSKIRTQMLKDGTVKLGEMNQGGKKKRRERE